MMQQQSLTGNPVHPRSIFWPNVIEDELQHIPQDSIHLLGCHCRHTVSENRHWQMLNYVKLHISIIFFKTSQRCKSKQTIWVSEMEHLIYSGKFEQVPQHLIELHWMLIAAWINYMILINTYKCHNDLPPANLCDTFLNKLRVSTTCLHWSPC